MIDITPDKPVLIAGPTAAGKSALAVHIAETQGGVIVSADALQVFDGWCILTARPGPDDLAGARHALYGHVPFDAPYSTGQWLREVQPFLQHQERPIIVGGTGLNFAALTRGLADIPAIPAHIRQAADQRALKALITDLDPATSGQLDLQNRARVQRAWEVQTATGRSLADWQAATPQPLLPIDECIAINMDAPKTWLDQRIATRFDQMLAQGALDEAKEMLPHWDASHQSSKAIGAVQLIEHLQGQMSLDDARQHAVIASRQYAKRQRTWFRGRHRDWWQVSANAPDLLATLRFVGKRRD